MKKAIRNFLNGAAFGIVETVPGVSGGTIAIILGFYYEVISTVNHFREDLKKSLKFLCPFILGAAVGVLTFISIINYLLEHYSFPTMSFFIGLIAGIIPVIFSKVKEPRQNFKFKEIMLIVIPILILVAISHLKGLVGSGADPAETIKNIDVFYMIFIFFTGMLAAAALVIPGISGSFVMLLLGVYPLVSHTLSSVRILLSDITNVGIWLNIFKVAGPLAIGIIVGGLSMARLIEKLLNNYHKTVYLIIMGLLLGSFYALFNDPIIFRSGISVPVIILGAETLFIGAVISYNLGKKRL